MFDFGVREYVLNCERMVTFLPDGGEFVRPCNTASLYFEDGYYETYHWLDFCQSPDGEWVPNWHRDC